MARTVERTPARTAPVRTAPAPAPAAAKVTVLQINRIKCDGYGMCAELLPEMLELDDWGYPIFRRTDVPPAAMGHAERAVADCPVLALRLVRQAASR